MRIKPQFLGGTARSTVTMPTELSRLLLFSFSTLSESQSVSVETTVTGELERLGTVSSLRVGLACHRLEQVRGETVERK
jgi:hypothetical protein